MMKQKAWSRNYGEWSSTTASRRSEESSKASRRLSFATEVIYFQAALLARSKRVGLQAMLLLFLKYWEGNNP